MSFFFLTPKHDILAHGQSGVEVAVLAEVANIGTLRRPMLAENSLCPDRAIIRTFNVDLPEPLIPTTADFHTRRKVSG